MSNIRTCGYCGLRIMKVLELWCAAEFADINGFCRRSNDDLHTPHVTDIAELRHPANLRQEAHEHTGQEPQAGDGAREGDGL